MLNESVAKYTDHHMTTVEGHVKVNEAAKAMVESKIESILVFEDSNVTGILTTRDIFADVVAKGKNPKEVTVSEIAHKPILKIHKDAKVKEAISLMNTHDIRRLIVTDGQKPIGIISRKILVGNLGELSTALPELEIPKGIRCPYCSSLFDDKHSLSKHIDDIHVGKGLFEGNLSQAEKLGSIKTAGSPKTI